MANLLCQHGYFFPVGECNKNLSVKDDSSLYRFQVSTFSSPLYRIRRNPSSKIWNLPDWQYTLESLAAVFAVGIKLSIDWQTWRETTYVQTSPNHPVPLLLINKSSLSSSVTMAGSRENAHHDKKRSSLLSINCPLPVHFI